jgi:hypothetical protein
MESLFLTTAIIGLIEFIKSLNNSQWENAEIIAACAIVGLLVGMWGIDHLTVVTGIQAGLSAAGIYKGVKLVGGQ